MELLHAGNLLSACLCRWVRNTWVYVLLAFKSIPCASADPPVRSMPNWKLYKIMPKKGYEMPFAFELKRMGLRAAPRSDGSNRFLHFVWGQRFVEVSWNASAVCRNSLFQRSREIWILWQRREKLFHVMTIRHRALLATACCEKLVNNLLLSVAHDTCPTCSWF